MRPLCGSGWSSGLEHRPRGAASRGGAAFHGPSRGVRGISSTGGRRSPGHRFARRRALSRRARGPGFRPSPKTPSSKGRELAEDVVQDAAVVGEAARWRTTGSRAGERPRAVREGRASARCRKRRPQRVASWRRTSCRMPPWWARRRAGEPPVRAPASALAPCARAGLPPVAGNAVLKGSRAGGGRSAGCRRGGSTRLPSGSAAAPVPRTGVRCRRSGGRPRRRCARRRRPGR